MTSAYKNWLDKTIQNDQLQGVQAVGTRPAELDNTQILQPPSPPLPQSELAAVIASHRTEVKHAFQLRKENGKPAEPGAKGSVRHVSTYDDSKMAKFEADMLKKFADKVATPKGSIRPTRVDEQHEANASEFSRANELFDKKDFLAALAEFEAAVQVPELKLYALVNRGNAYKARKAFAEAAACYEDALDLASLETHEGRLLHSCALNNLGAACLEARQMDQALQHFAAALSLNPKCYLALKNRALLHMGHAEVQAEAELRTIVPAQHEMALSYYTRAMDQDWSLPNGFRAGKVFIRLESRMTGAPGDLVHASAHVRNEVYHFATNLTHVKSDHV